MKLTWFGGTTLRVHIGGCILVVDPVAIGGVDAAELVSGADRVFSRADALPEVDARRWQPRRAPTLVDDAAPAEVLVHRLDGATILIDALGEPPLLLASGPVPAAGRWGSGAVVVVLGDDHARTAVSAVEGLAPRLIAVAGNDTAVEAVLAAVGGRLDGTGFMAMEPGLALEV